MSEPIDDGKLTVDLEAPGVISAPCEFCGQTYYIDPDPKDPKLMHALPMCPNFEVMDPIAYLVANRKIKEDRAQKRGGN